VRGPRRNSVYSVHLVDGSWRKLPLAIGANTALDRRTPLFISPGVSFSALQQMCFAVFSACDALSPLARPPLMRSACICGRQTKRGPVVNWNEFCKRKLKWSQFPDCGGLHCSQLPGQNGTRHKQTLNTHSEYLALYCCLRKNIKKSCFLIFLILSYRKA